MPQRVFPLQKFSYLLPLHRRALLVPKLRIASREFAFVLLIILQSVEVFLRNPNFSVESVSLFYITHSINFLM